MQGTPGTAARAVSPQRVGLPPGQKLVLDAISSHAASAYR